MTWMKARMIAFAPMPGYTNHGEAIPFSDFYHFKGIRREEGYQYPSTIIIHYYEDGNKAFKGILLDNNKTFQNIPLTDSEREAMKPYVGDVEQVDLYELVKGSMFEKAYASFRKVQKEKES